MTNDPFPFYETLTQTQLGMLFGESSHVVGRWLKELGLRLPNGKPSPRAIEAGWVTTCSDGPVSFPVWSKDKVVAALERAGHRRQGSDPQAPAPTLSTTITLVGPFSTRQESEDGWAIVGGDGIVSQWLRGRANAVFVTDLLNLAHKCGKLGSLPTP